MVIFAVIGGSALASVMVPETEKLIVEPGAVFAAVMAALRLPVPVGLRVDTVMVVCACAQGVMHHPHSMTPRQTTSENQRLIRRLDITIPLVARSCRRMRRVNS